MIILIILKILFVWFSLWVLICELLDLSWTILQDVDDTREPFIPAILGSVYATILTILFILFYWF